MQPKPVNAKDNLGPPPESTDGSDVGCGCVIALCILAAGMSATLILWACQGFPAFWLGSR